MHLSSFEPAVDDIVRAASATGPDLAYHLSSALDVARRRFTCAAPLTVDEHRQVAEALPLIEDRFGPLAFGFVPKSMLPRCFDALETMVRLWAEPAAVRLRAEPAALAEASSLVRLLQNAAHSIVLADTAATAAAKRRKRSIADA